MFNKNTAVPVPSEVVSDEIRKAFLGAVQQGRFQNALDLISDTNERALCTSKTTSKQSNVVHMLVNYLNASPNSGPLFDQKIKPIEDPNSSFSLFLKRIKPYAYTLIHTPDSKGEAPLSSFGPQGSRITPVIRALGISFGTQEDNKSHTSKLRHYGLFKFLQESVDITRQSFPIQIRPNSEVLVIGPGIASAPNLLAYSPEIKELLDAFNGKVARLICVDKHADVLVAAAQGSPDIAGYYPADVTPLFDPNSIKVRPPIETKQMTIEWTKESLNTAFNGQHDLILALNVLTYPIDLQIIESRREVTQKFLLEHNSSSSPETFLKKIVQGVAQHSLNMMNECFSHVKVGGHIVIDEQTLRIMSSPFGIHEHSSESLHLFLSLFVRKPKNHIQVIEASGVYRVFTKLEKDNFYLRDSLKATFDRYLDITVEYIKRDLTSPSYQGGGSL